MADFPEGEAIVIERLGAGFKIVSVCRHPSEPKPYLTPAVHYPTKALAMQFAELVQKANGFPIVDRTEP